MAGLCRRQSVFKHLRIRVATEPSGGNSWLEYFRSDTGAAVHQHVAIARLAFALSYPTIPRDDPGWLCIRRSRVSWPIEPFNRHVKFRYALVQLGIRRVPLTQTTGTIEWSLTSDQSADRAMKDRARTKSPTSDRESWKERPRPAPPFFLSRDTVYFARCRIRCFIKDRPRRANSRAPRAQTRRKVSMLTIAAKESETTTCQKKKRDAVTRIRRNLATSSATPGSAYENFVLALRVQVISHSPDPASVRDSASRMRFPFASAGNRRSSSF